MGVKFRDITTDFSAVFSGNHTPATYTRSYSTEVQQITSISHAPNHRSLGRSTSDIGGPFISTKLKWGPLPARIHLEGNLGAGPGGWISKGVLVPPVLEAELRTGVRGTPQKLKEAMPQAESVNSLFARGTTAISRCAPTNPVADGATAIAELVGARKLFTAPGSTGNVGSEYLNFEFGISPTIGDIQDLATAARDSEKILAQLERGSGKVIRRAYEFPPEVPTQEAPYNSGLHYPIFLGGGGPTVYEVGLGSCSITFQHQRTARFAGAFTYHLPPKGTWRRKIAELDVLYGVRPGVDTAWNALPWSWLADYHGNMGDVLKNLSLFSQDGLILKYGYITSRTERLARFTWSYPVRLAGSNGTWTTYGGSAEVSYTELMRRPATPFGFSLTTTSIGDYTPRQVAILSALGISQL